MKTENKIIKAFINENKPMTIREIAKKIKADYRITHFAAQRLIQKRILIAKSVGNSSLCSLNSIYCIEISQAEEERKKALLKIKDINQLYKEVIKSINTSFFIFLIFGSYAKGSKTKHSDIDMMFISNEKNFEKKTHDILSLLPLKTHALVFTEKDFIRMKDSKKTNVVKEAINHNIILHGIENYYRLKNA